MEVDMSVLSMLFGSTPMRKSSGNAVLEIEGGNKLVCQFNPDELRVQTRGKFATVQSMG